MLLGHGDPFAHSRPSRPLLLTTLACAARRRPLPYSALADPLGFTALPLDFLAVLAPVVVTLWVPRIHAPVGG